MASEPDLKAPSRVGTGKTPPSPTATSAIIPGPNPGDRLATYFEKFFTTCIGISTLGASLTFNRMVSTPVQPWINYAYNIYTIQNFIALAWLMFLITLVTTSLFASLLSLYKPQVIEAFSTKNHHNKMKTMWAATGVSLLLFCLLLTSFVFLSLVTASYVGPVGWVALGITSSFGLVGIGGIIWQSPLGWPDWVYRILPPTGKDEPYVDRSNYQGGLGYDNKLHTSTWPQIRGDSARAQLQQASRKSRTGLGANLTGGILPSSIRKKRSYTDILREKEFDIDAAESKGIEESFSSEKDFLASLGAPAMRIKPRVSWPVENVVSKQFSPPPNQQQQPQPPQPSRPPRAWKHDRRERMQAQAQSQPIAQFQEQPATRARTPSPLAPPPQARYSTMSETTLSQQDQEYEEDDGYTASQFNPSDLSSINPARYSYIRDEDDDSEEHHPALHHQTQQVYRTVPPTRRSGHRPVWEMESDARARTRTRDDPPSPEQQRASVTYAPGEGYQWSDVGVYSGGGF